MFQFASPKTQSIRDWSAWKWFGGGLTLPKYPPAPDDLNGDPHVETVAQDTFTEGSNTALTDHAPDVGTGWEVEEAQFTVIAADSELRHNTNALHMARETTDVGTSDMNVTVRAKCGSSTLRQAGVCARMAAGNFNHAIQAYLTGTASAVDVVLFKEIAGVRTELGAWAGNLPADQFVTLTLACRATGFHVSVDGVERIFSEDTSLSENTYAGVIMNGALGTTTRLDEFLSEAVG